MKSLNKIITVLLVISLLFSLTALVSCGGENGADKTADKKSSTPAKQDNNLPAADTTAYTVTVVDNDGNPIKGIKIAENTEFKSVTTDDNGKATFNLTKAPEGVTIVTFPDGYKKLDYITGTPLHAKFNGEKDITITLEKETNEMLKYTVKVVDQDGNAVKDVELQLCPNGTCLSDQFITDANGEVSKDLSPDLPVDIKIKEVPEGYTIPDPVNALGYHGAIAAGEYEAIITIIKN